jgi:hypothetical protein
MDADRFDRIARGLAVGATRRRLLAGLAGGVAALGRGSPEPAGAAPRRCPRSKKRCRATCIPRRQQCCPVGSDFPTCPGDFPACCPRGRSESCCPGDFPTCCPPESPADCCPAGSTCCPADSEVACCPAGSTCCSAGTGADCCPPDTTCSPDGCLD